MPSPRDQPQQEAGGILKPKGYQEEVAYQSGALQEETESVRQWRWVRWVKEREKESGGQAEDEGEQTSVIVTSRSTIFRDSLQLSEPQSPHLSPEIKRTPNSSKHAMHRPHTCPGKRVLSLLRPLCP